LIIEFLSACELKTDAGVALHTISEHCTANGISYHDVRTGMIAASQRGWISIAGDYAHLTEAGYVALTVANANA
jgi:hypothetical protein